MGYFTLLGICAIICVIVFSIIIFKGITPDLVADVRREMLERDSYKL